MCFWRLWKYYDAVWKKANYEHTKANITSDALCKVFWAFFCPDSIELNLYWRYSTLDAVSSWARSSISISSYPYLPFRIENSLRTLRLTIDSSLEENRYKNGRWRHLVYINRRQSKEGHPSWRKNSWCHLFDRHSFNDLVGDHPANSQRRIYFTGPPGQIWCVMNRSEIVVEQVSLELGYVDKA